MRHSNTLFLLFVLTVLQACASSHYSSEGGVASEGAALSDTKLYLNADFITMDDALPEVEAIAVREGIIIAAGGVAETRLAAGSSALEIDLAGNTVLPGLIDAHGHISFASLFMATANISSPPVGSANDIEDVLNLLSAKRDATPDEDWIIGWGYDDSLLKEKRHPTKQDLDKVSSTRPIALTHVSGHLMSCNSVCLQRAEITSSTSNPDGGIIRRLPGGNEPDGVLEETAMTKLRMILPKPTKEIRLALLNKAQQYYASHGLTTVQDGAASIEEIDILREAAANKKLYLDVVSFPYAAYVKDRLDEYKSSKSYQDNFRVGGFKLVLDGSPQGKTAWLTKPYLHAPHGQDDSYVGYATLTDEQAQFFVNKAFEDNTPLLAHANGDAAADQLINAVTIANQKYGNADRRTVMIHAQTVREDQIDAMLEQNIMPSYFSAHTFYWGDWHRDSVFGVERASRISPLRSSADKGLRYTTHNDTPIVPPDMMRLVWASANRITRSGKILGEAQQATVMEALRSITIDAAHQYFEEDTKGSITVGKVADLVILSQNPLTIDKADIKDIQVLKTIKDGVVVYQK